MSSVVTLCLGCMTEQPPHTVCPYCGFNEATARNPEGALCLGTFLGSEFIVGKVLGSGGFGITYLAFNTAHRKKVAIKEYFPRDQCCRSTNTLTVQTFSRTSEADFRHGLNKFFEEAQVLERFKAVPGIVNVSESFEANHTGYMVMGYLQGVTLEQYLKHTGGTLSYAQTINILMPVFDALKQVHQAGLLHRDISPDNIFITREKQIKLIDFGAARQSSQEKGQNHSIILKEGYAPEEQYRSKGQQGPWTDVYALAATLYHCLVGKKPPQALDRAIEGITLELPSALGVEISQTQEAVLSKALSVQAKDRHQDAGQFQNAIVTTHPNAPSSWSCGLDSNEKEADSTDASEQSTPKSETDQSITQSTIDWLDGMIAKEGDLSKAAELDGPKEVPKEANDTTGSRSSRKLWHIVFLLILGTVAATILLRNQNSKLDHEACTQAKRFQSLPAWNRYIKKFPKGECISLAYSSIQKLNQDAGKKSQKDQVACKSAKTANTLDSWNEYIRNHPMGECMGQARRVKRRLLRLKEQMIQIPAGKTWFGCSQYEESDSAQFERMSTECPEEAITPYKIHVPSFLIDKTEVTVPEYKACVASGHCTAAHYGDTTCHLFSKQMRNEDQEPTSLTGSLSVTERFGRDNQPVSCVSWHQAHAYCKWAGKRLPTQVEWEKAARGPDDQRPYSWGKRDPSCDLAAVDLCDGYQTEDVCSKHGPRGDNNFYGLCDMTGNVWEWTADWHHAAFYNTENPAGAESGTRRVLRGGAFTSDSDELLHINYREKEPPDTRAVNYGFRCASSR